MGSNGGSKQNLLLFVRGNAVAGAPIIKSSDQFPKPPIIFGIKKKKVITKVWAVTLNLTDSVIREKGFWLSQFRSNKYS